MFPASISSESVIASSNVRPQLRPPPSSAASMVTPASTQSKSEESVLPGSAERDAGASSVSSGKLSLTLSTSRTFTSNGALLSKHRISSNNISCNGTPEGAPAVRRQPEGTFSGGQQKLTSDQPTIRRVREMKEPLDLKREKSVLGPRSPRSVTSMKTISARNGRVTSTRGTTAGPASSYEETAFRQTCTMKAGVPSTTEREAETSRAASSRLPSENLSNTIVSTPIDVRANQRVSGSSGISARDFHQHGAISGNVAFCPSRDHSPVPFSKVDQMKKLDVHDTNELLADGAGLRSTSSAPASLNRRVAWSLQQAASTPGATCTEPSQRAVRFENMESEGAFTQRTRTPVVNSLGDGEDLAPRNGCDLTKPPAAVSSETISSAGVPPPQRYSNAPATSTETLPVVLMTLLAVGQSENPAKTSEICGLASGVSSTAVSVELTLSPTIGPGKGGSRDSTRTAEDPDHHKKDTLSERTIVLPQRRMSRGQLNRSPAQPKEDNVQDMSVRQDDGEGGPTALRSPHPTTYRGATATATPQQQTPKTRATVADSMHAGVSRRENNSVASESSREIVLYTGGQHLPTDQCGAAQVSPVELVNFTFTAKKHSPFNPLACPTTSVPLHSSRNEAGPRGDGAAASSVPIGFSVGESTPTSFSLGSRGGPVDRLDAARAWEGQRPEWVVISAEKAKQAAQKLRDEADKNRVLESTIKKHNRERVLIYDAAMKQAAKREEEGVNEASQTFDREQSTMRAEVDRELGKINDLYHERCRDYAQMVTDECEDEVSKNSADLRKDWAQQKKTIAQLVRNGGEEDRQETVIARAVMEQLQEEKRDELTASRADIYADVKMEFEQREVTIRDALQSEFQADLDGQLLLAEIRHEKEMDQLRTELSGGEANPSKVAAGDIVVWNRQTLTGAVKDTSRINSGGTPTTPSPSASRRSLHQNIQVSVGAGRGGRRGAAPSGNLAVIRKLSSFKPPVQKAALDDKKKTAKMPPHRSASKPISISRTRTNHLSRTPAIRKRVAGAQHSISQVSPENDNTAPGGDDEDAEIDGGITSALMVSPTKAMPGMVTVTPSEDSGATSTAEPPRPKKRAKRLFSA